MIRIVSCEELKKKLKTDNLMQFTEEALINNIRVMIPEAECVSIHLREDKSSYMAIVMTKEEDDYYV